MNDATELRTDPDGWPMPSADVMRELERPALAWPEPSPGEETALQPVAA
ncbi:MAG: hypothetical protein JOZ56_09205 [Actinobacteria bacterium]|nr:hypothetical protein [Actinomycetota bacterium]MBV8563252.1 hypothetical protein [Actinomycetota bacterium]